MTPIPTLPGITSTFVDTPRLRQHVLSCGPSEGTPVVFIHGNFSAATYWEELMLTLAAQGPSTGSGQAFRCLAPDLRGYGWSEDKLIDATRGYREWSDDVDALLVTLGIGRTHLVGWSMAGGMVYRYLADHADKVLTVTLQAPVSPYGFGGSKGIEGAPCFDDCAGSGGGVVSPVFVQCIQAGDRSADDANSPRNIINAFYYKAPFRAAREEDFLTAALMEKTGPDKYPGDSVPSANWPNVGPGVLGPVNCWSPKYLRDEVADLLAADPKPPILWIHGDADMIVSDNSMFDLATLGKLGYVPGWPGDEVVPPQPMIGQTRAVFDRYAATGGSYREVVFTDCAHSPHIEKPGEWVAEFLKHAQ
ncbi:MAG: alpha/beta hydrolase [Chloroflexi bacterium]|nr:alpha/beta hydrolase [Chloroflexota bacterium]